MPLAIEQRSNLLANPAHDLFDQGSIAGEADLEGIFQDHGQQFRRGLAAIDRAIETGGEQIGDAAYMVDMHMSNQHCLDVVHREIDFLAVRSSAVWRTLIALEQAAVDQHAAAIRQLQFVAGAGDALGGAVVQDFVALLVHLAMLVKGRAFRGAKPGKVGVFCLSALLPRLISVVPRRKLFD